MPTRDRRSFVPLALAGFQRQQYPDKELIVVDDSLEPVDDLVAGIAGVTYLRCATGTTIGEKRNLAWAAATGEVIIQWDDDDWYGDERLLHQVAPMLLQGADATGIQVHLVLDATRGEFWQMDDEVRDRVFRSGIHSGTLAIRSEVRARGVEYPHSSAGEDVELIFRLRRSGGKLFSVENRALHVYVRHGTNAWAAFEPGVFKGESAWQRVDRPDFFAEDLVAAYVEAARQLR